MPSFFNSKGIHVYTESFIVSYFYVKPLINENDALIFRAKNDDITRPVHSMCTELAMIIMVR